MKRLVAASSIATLRSMHASKQLCRTSTSRELPFPNSNSATEWFVGSASLLALFLGAPLLAAPRALADGGPPGITEVLSTPGAAQGDELGRSVSVAGPFVAGGRWLADPGGSTNAGAARIWRRTAEGTTLSEGEVVAPDGAANDEFGISVALDAGCDLGRAEDSSSWPRLIVGAWTADLPAKADAGAAYVFRRDPSTGIWHFESKLTASDSAANSQFGRSVSIDGGLAVVGAWKHGIDRGALYIFRLEAGTWVQEAKLLASDGTIGDGLGVSVAMQADRVIGGAWGDDTGAVGNHGSAYVFRRNAPGSWTQEAKLVAPTLVGSEEFGRGVAMDGESAIVGSWPFFNDGPGAAHVFTRSGTAWSHQAALAHPTPGPADYFGFSVGISGDVAVVGAWADDIDGISNQGSAHFFSRAGGLWSHTIALTRPEPQGSSYFGFSVAVDDAIAAIGSRLDDINGVINAGSVTLICVRPEACSNCPLRSLPGDVDGDGSVDGADLALVLGAWGDQWSPPAPPIPADQSGDGIVDGADIAIVLGNWTG